MEDLTRSEKFIVKPLFCGFKLLDLIMRPLMWILGGGRNDSLQETHFWHCQRIDGTKIDSKKSVYVDGRDGSKFSNNILPFPFFHAPLLGGWKCYSVFEICSDTQVWYVGWINIKVPSGFRKKCCIHKLGISDRRIKMLTFPNGCVTQFFAIDENGFQICLSEVGSGVLGDCAYPGVRLF